MSIRGVLILSSADFCGHCRVFVQGRNGEPSTWDKLRDDRELRQIVAFKHYETIQGQRPEPAFLRIGTENRKGWPAMTLVPLDIYRQYFTNVDLTSSRPDSVKSEFATNSNDMPNTITLAGARPFEILKKWLVESTANFPLPATTGEVPVVSRSVPAKSPVKPVIKSAYVAPSPTVARQLPTSRQLPPLPANKSTSTSTPVPQKRKSVFIPRRV